MFLSVTGFGSAVGSRGSLLIFESVCLSSVLASWIVVSPRYGPQDQVVAMSERLNRCRKEIGPPVASVGRLGATLIALNAKSRGVERRTAPEK